MDRQGRVCGVLARRRLRMFPPDFGNSTSPSAMPARGGPRRAEESLRRLLAGIRVPRHLQRRVQVRRAGRPLQDPRGQRPPWWFVGFAADCGVDVCDMACRDALGEEVEPVTSYRGRSPLRLTPDGICRAAERRRATAGRPGLSFHASPGSAPETCTFSVGRPERPGVRDCSRGAARSPPETRSCDAALDAQSLPRRPTFPEWNRARGAVGRWLHRTASPEYLDALCEAAGGKLPDPGRRRRGRAARRDRPLRARLRLWGLRFAPAAALLQRHRRFAPTRPAIRPSARRARTRSSSPARGPLRTSASAGRSALPQPPDRRSRVLWRRVGRPDRSTVMSCRSPISTPLWSRMEQNLRRLVDRCARAGALRHGGRRLRQLLSPAFAGPRAQGGRASTCRGPRFGDSSRGCARRVSPASTMRGSRTATSISSQLVLLGPHPVTHTVRGRGRRRAPQARRHRVPAVERVPAARRARASRRTT